VNADLDAPQPHAIDRADSRTVEEATPQPHAENDSAAAGVNPLPPAAAPPWGAMIGTPHNSSAGAPR